MDRRPQEEKKPAEVLLRPDAGKRQSIESGSSADILMCWSCSSCDLQCPVNIATNRLRPQKLVRLANLGLMEELFCLPEIWYCLTCRQCARTCPNSVKPSSLIKYVRREVLRRGIIPWSIFRSYSDLFTRFQRARWQAAAACMASAIPEVTASRWQKWTGNPVRESISRVIAGNAHTLAFSKHNDLFQKTKGAQCYTCGECSSACPVSGYRSVFDPRSIFRMVQLGLIEEVAGAPGIWLCLNCGRCTDACPQQVDGLAIIEQLRLLAVENGVVDRGFFYRLQEADRNLFPWYIEAVDSLLGFAKETVGSCVERAGTRHSKKAAVC